MRPNRLSFQELVEQNKQHLWNDPKALDEIEKQIEEKYTNKEDSSSIVN